VHSREFHNSKESKSIAELHRIWPLNSFSKDNEKSQPQPQKKGRPSIIDSGDENWTFIPEADYFRSDFRTACFFVMLEWVFVTWHRFAYWDVKAFPVPLFLTNRLLEQYTKKLKFKAIKLCDSKMDLIKWQLNWVECNFGLKSYFWFQIELALRARSILKSRVWFQTKLHSTQFNYHYISLGEIKSPQVA